MNIIRKFILSLLLTASLFAIACGNTTNNTTQTADGEACTKSEECKEGSKCYVAFGKKGKCAKTCTGIGDSSCGTATCVADQTEKGGSANTSISVCITLKEDGKGCAKSNQCKHGACALYQNRPICVTTCSKLDDSECKGTKTYVGGRAFDTSQCSAKGDTLQFYEDQTQLTQVCMPPRS